MRVVLDTNIVISSILSSSGAARALLDLARAGHITLVTSPALLDELEDVLTRFFPRPIAAEIRAATAEISIIAAPETISPASRDPDDDHVLSAAVSGEAVFIVSRDQDLLTLREYETIPILDAAPALQAIQAALDV
ncbi:MAG: putative toxin-antitoxin system toxin component, PIN family [Chloroflexota bacterium]